MTRLPTLEDLLAEARAHGFPLTPDSPELGGIGLDYAVAHARDAEGHVWILRTARRPDVVAGSEVEARVLRLVAPRLPVRVPDWRVHTPTLIAYPMLPGLPLVTVDEGAPTWNIVDQAAPSEAFLESVARLLAGLDAIPVDAAVEAGVPQKDIADVRETHARAMADHRADLAPSEAVWARWQRWLDDDALWPDHVALVHADLHGGHLLLDGAGRVTGVLDWTEGHVGDPATDFAMFHGHFGGPATERLVTLFEAAGGRTWPGLARHAAERWSAFPALAAAWAAKADNPMALEVARAQVAALDAQS